MCLCPLGEQVWKQARHRGTAWRSQPRWAQASLSVLWHIPRVLLWRNGWEVPERWNNSFQDEVSAFLSPSLYFSWEGFSLEVYYRSVYLWLLDKVMELTVPKTRQNATCKMWGREFSKNCRPGPEAAVTAPLKRNVQFVPSHETRHSVFACKVSVANLEVEFTYEVEVTYESKLEKGVPWTLASWNFWLFLGFTFNLLLENLWSSFSLWARISQLISSLSHRLIKWNPSYCPAFWSVMQ